MDPRPLVNVYASRQELSAALGAYVTRLATSIQAVQNRFCVALSGGSLLDVLGLYVASESSRDKVDWSTWHVFWVDERWVPRGSPESNYGHAWQTFLKHVPIPGPQIHAMDEAFSPQETACAYESVLARAFRIAADRIPRFDLILLGIGEDGHTASLFPNHAASRERRRWVVPVADAPKPPPIRITMTLPLINNARNVAVVASGPGKRRIVSQALHPEKTPADLPIQQVNPLNGKFKWFVDQAAAS